MRGFKITIFGMITVSTLALSDSVILGGNKVTARCSAKVRLFLVSVKSISSHAHKTASWYL